MILPVLASNLFGIRTVLKANSFTGQLLPSTHSSGQAMKDLGHHKLPTEGHANCGRRYQLLQSEVTCFRSFPLDFVNAGTAVFYLDTTKPSCSLLQSRASAVYFGRTLASVGLALRWALRGPCGTGQSGLLRWLHQSFGTIKGAARHRLIPTIQ